MDLQLRAKTAIVTGGGSNIGRAISLMLGSEGANVVIADIGKADGDRVAAEIVKSGGKAICIKTDVTSTESVADTVQQAVAQFGQIHILVNNVGWSDPKLFVDTDAALWDKIYSINLRGDFVVLKAVLPHMIEKGYGRVVNISSDAGRNGEFRDSIYASAKAGVIGLTKSVAREVGRFNITVNCVCPGMTVPLNDEEVGSQSVWAGENTAAFRNAEALQKMAKDRVLRRLGTAEDTAKAVAFMVSDVANYITGQTLSVSGGYVML